MSTTNNNLVIKSKDVCKFYPINEEYLRVLALDLSRSFGTCGNAWTRMSCDEIVPILKSALYLYFFNTHARVLLENGRTIPSKEKLEYLTSMITVPRFVRDVLREICRPMFFGASVYYPNIPFADPGPEKPLSYLFGEIPALPSWHLACQVVKYDMVELDPECPRACPLSFAIESRKQVFSVAHLEDWRLEAFSRTRHLTSTLENVSSQEHTTENLSCKEPYDELVINRQAGQVFGFVYLFDGIHREYGFFGKDFRFPSFDDRSMTPPRSDASNVVINKVRKAKQNRKGPPLEVRTKVDVLEK